jgi:sulfoxide reductase heme-binding subunit YedZ
VRQSSRRVVRHVALAGIFGGGAFALYAGAADGPPAQRLSIATAYLALVFLSTTLLLGPFNHRSGRANPVSTNLRRDIGIWTAIGGIVHTIVGLQVHMGGDVIRYFVPGHGRGFSKSTMAFLAANYTGIIATAIVALLLAISNDRALRALGTTRWKRIQRLNYLLFALVAVHGALYLAVERASLIRIVPFVIITGFAATIQIQGRISKARGLHRS